MVEVAGANRDIRTLEVLVSQVEQQYTQDTTVVCVNNASPSMDAELEGWNSL